jgi:hypothetical protein
MWDGSTEPSCYPGRGFSPARPGGSSQHDRRELHDREDLVRHPTVTVVSDATPCVALWTEIATAPGTGFDLVTAQSFAGTFGTVIWRRNAASI